MTSLERAPRPRTLEPQPAPQPEAAQGAEPSELPGITEGERELVHLLRPLPAGDFGAAWSGLPRPEATLEAARRHGLEGVVVAAVAGLEAHPDRELAPPAREFAARAGRLQAEGRLRHAWTRAALQEASASLAEAGLAHLVLKGPPLAEALYPDPGARRSIDLDLLVRPADLERARAALEGLGYFCEEGPASDYARRHHVHLHLARADRPLIELHFRAFRGFGVELGAAPLLSRAVPSGIGAALVLSPEDRFLYLSLHAAGHLLARLSWLYDLKLLAHQGVDLHAVRAAAEALGVRAPYALVWRALRAIGAPLAAEPVPSRAEEARLQGAVRLRRAHQEGPGDTPRAILERLAFQALLAPSPGRRARFLAHHLARIARRRAQRAWPALAPEGWAG